MTASFGDDLPELTVASERSAAPSPSLEASTISSSVLRIPVGVQVVIGTARLPLSQIAELAPGSTIALEEKLGTEARILVNGREVARGELYVLDGEDNRLGITITQVSGSSNRDST